MTTVCREIFAMEYFRERSIREFKFFYRPLPILPNHVYNLFTQRAKMTPCESCMRGHHVYKDVWVPDAMRPEVLTCVRKAGNDADPYSVAMINSSMTVVGHESVINSRRRDT